MVSIILMGWISGCVPGQFAEITAQPSPTLMPDSAVSIDDVITNLKGLSLEAFFEESYTQLQIRDPDMLIAYSGCYAMRHNELPDISDAYLWETRQLETAGLDLLHAYDRKVLPPDQQLSYDIYEWYLDHLICIV